jgi:hypothetical protein
MPEYLYPGVYVEEVDAGVSSIPGVSTSIDRAALESIAAEFRRTMRTHVPAWTDHGYAIDGNGEEISVPCGATLAAPAHGDRAFVTLRFWEHACPPSPTAESASPDVPSIEEACILAISPDVVAPACALARLVRSEGSWQVDPAFVTPRVAQKGS